MTAPLPPENPSPENPSLRDPSREGPSSQDPAVGGPGVDDRAAVEPSSRPAAGLDSRGHVKRTRASDLWIGLITAAVLAILFLVFIAQNSDKVPIEFLGWEGRVSLAISLLLSAVIGALVVAVPGIVRIIQLRRALRKNAKA
jgi:putative membrane protein